MADLGFRPLSRTMRTDPATRRMEMVFLSQPRISGVRGKGPAFGVLRNGDVVTAIGGHPITSPEAARRYSEIRPGDRVRLTVRRARRLVDVTIAAAARCIAIPPAPPEPPVADAPEAPNAPVPPNPSGGAELLPERLFGLAIDCDDCGDDERGAFRFRAPPVVVGVAANSPAARAGLRVGDRLTHVNEIPLTSAMGLPALQAIRPGDTARISYMRGSAVQLVTLKALPAN
jgi:S1-C subfamily serine protease